MDRSNLRRLGIFLIVSLLFSACNGWPNTTQGNSIGLAAAEVGTTRATAPWALPKGHDCWNFINWVEETAGTPGWVPVDNPGQLTELQIDPNGFQPGDIVTFAIFGQLGSTIIHVGIVYVASPNSFGSVEWNSVQSPDMVVINYHSTNGPDPGDGLVVTGSYLP